MNARNPFPAYVASNFGSAKDQTLKLWNLSTTAQCKRACLGSLQAVANRNVLIAYWFYEHVYKMWLFFSNIFENVSCLVWLQTMLFNEAHYYAALRGLNLDMFLCRLPVCLLMISLQEIWSQRQIIPHLCMHVELNNCFQAFLVHWYLYESSHFSSSRSVT